MNWETYTAFGDSITIGARTYLGYPEVVGSTLSAHLSKDWNVINHSACGFKAIDLARYIDKHFLSLKESQSSVTTILIGTNDIKEQTRIEDFIIALNLVILKTKLFTTNNNVIVIAIPQFHKGISYPYSIGMNVSIAKFNSAIRDLVTHHNIRMMDIQHAAEDFLDGVHLNSNGIATFSDQIVKYILKDKGIHIDQTQ